MQEEFKIGDVVIFKREEGVNDEPLNVAKDIGHIEKVYKDENYGPVAEVRWPNDHYMQATVTSLKRLMHPINYQLPITFEYEENK